MREEARYQSLASCGAALIAFIGVCHEFVGHLLFPWAPALFGPVIWHGLGIFAIVVGVSMLLGTLRLIAFPVVAFASIAAVLAKVVFVFTAVAYLQFHLFALVAAMAGAVTAVFHRKGTRAGRPTQD